MRWFVLAAIGVVCSLASASAGEMRPLNVIVFGGGLSWPVFVAKDVGLFAKHGLDVNVTETPGSVFQMTGLHAGTFDIAMTPFDNVVAYQEGQGETKLAGDPDFFAFMGGISSALRLIADPKVATFADLRGRTLGVDSPMTGYTLLLYDILARQGLPHGTYEVARSGGTTFRVQALEEGKIAATMVSSPQELAPEAKGFRRLGDVQSIVGPYQALCGVARRSWAKANANRLVDYIAAYVDADAWLRDAAHRADAVAIYVKYVKGATPAAAEAALDVMLAPTEGFQPHAAFDGKGADAVLAIRSQYGTPQKELTDWRRYTDDTFYDRAIAKH